MRLLICITLFCLTTLCLADARTDCSKVGGSYLTGVVVGAPTFKKAVTELKGVALSHTHLPLRADQDNKTYDVAIDNVFAIGHDVKPFGVPFPLNLLGVNDRIEVCGQLFSDPHIGIHWVHTNCEDTPTKDNPNGWIKIIDKNNQAISENLENNTEYCYLWK